MAETFTVPCPKCGSNLKLRDRALLGKVGKCPKCQHKFKLVEPEEVELELADEPSTPVGTSAKWVPDEPSAAPITLAEAATATPQAPAAPVVQEPAFPAITTEDTTSATSVTSRSRPVRKKKKFPWAGVITGGVIACLLVCVGWAVMEASKENQVADSDKNAPVEDKEYQQAKQELEQTNEAVKAASPTKGEPIDLTMMPAGVRVILHMRPANLWASNRDMQVFRASFGPLLDTGFVEWFKSICRREPQQVEEALIGVVLGARGEPPKYATVVRLVQEEKRSALMDEINGAPLNDTNTDVYVNDTHAMYIKDKKTFAICPASMASDLLTFSDSPAMTANEMEQILMETDRDRLATIAFLRADVEQHLASLFPKAAHPLFQQVLDWFGEDVEAIAWSIHLGDKFYTDVRVRNRAAESPYKLQRTLKAKLSKLPEDLVAVTKKMQPQQRGFRKLIGRLPAMFQVVAMKTQVGIDLRSVRMATSLPVKAGPNLALASLLSWDESTRTNFNADIPIPTIASNENNVPEKLEDRLKTMIEVDYRRTPFADAVAYIAEEIKMPIKVDGDALEAAGLTRNMPQTFKFEKIAAGDVIKEFIKLNVPNVKGDKVALVLDYEGKRGIITTEFAAKKNGQTVYQIP